MDKTVTIRTPNFSNEATRELRDALRDVDPEIQLLGTAALSGHAFINEIVLVAVGAGLGEVAKRTVDVVGAWAKTWLAKDPDAKVVQILGPDGRIVSEIRRPTDR